MNKLKITSAFAAGVTVLAGVSAQAQTLDLQLKAANYNATTGVWTDSSGNNNTATWTGGTSGEAIPALSGTTPNGSAALDLLGTGSANGAFTLASGISGASGYTLFAYYEVAPGAVGSAGGQRNALTGSLYGQNSGGALSYDYNSGTQDFLREYQADIAHGTTTLTQGSFYLADLTVNSSSSAFRLNGAADGTGGGSSFPNTIATIGNNTGGGEPWDGYLAEIDIYSGVLTSGQISTVENTLISEYVTVPEPSSWVMLAGGLGTLVAVRRFRRS